MHAGRAPTCQAGVLTARTLADAIVLPVPVPQQEGGVPGARQDVAVPPDVRLGAGQARHHVAVPEHNLGQFACKQRTDLFGGKGKNMWL